ncbi:MAG: sigma-70 family RNA polymerase sigma factor, partial [Gammaproteobacteria bacterium]
GDAAAFEILYAKHKGPLYRYLLRQCGSRDSTDELFQDVWMKLIQGRAHYQVKAKFTTYLYTIARHRLIDHYRKQGDSSFDNDTEVDEINGREQDQPHKRMELQQQAAQLLAAIAGLPALQRDALLLKEEAGMSLAEIATLTGVNTETVKSRLRYAIKKLHQVIKL